MCPAFFCLVLAIKGEDRVRHNLDHIDEGEQLLRRKEIYEALHPETKKGAINQYTKVLSETVSDSKSKTFAEDTAEKMGITPCVVRQPSHAIPKNLGVPENPIFGLFPQVGTKNSVARCCNIAGSCDN